MKPIRIATRPIALAVFVVIAAGWEQGTKRAEAQQPQPPPTIAAAVDRQINTIEKEIVEAAEAMPEDRFDFSPESLKIPGSEYKGVRTFAVQAKHVAASNYFLWSALTGDKLPDDLKGGNRPQNVKTKADVVRLLKDSFAVGHRAAATLTAENMLQPVEQANRLACSWPHSPSPTHSITTDRWSSICG